MKAEEESGKARTWADESLDIATRRILLAGELARLKVRKAAAAAPGRERDRAGESDRGGDGSPAAASSAT